MITERDSVFEKWHGGGTCLAAAATQRRHWGARKNSSLVSEDRRLADERLRDHKIIAADFIANDFIARDTE